VPPLRPKLLAVLRVNFTVSVSVLMTTPGRVEAPGVAVPVPGGQASSRTRLNPSR
jgi:hypothetical protein